MTLNRRIRKTYICFITALIMVLSVFTQAVPVFAVTGEAPVTDSSAAIVVDAGTGAVVYRKNENTSFNPKAMTKLMTALVAADKKKLTDGDIAEIGDMLTASDSKGAEALAKEISGSTSAFCKEMNAKAKELGCKGTNFVSPEGQTSDEKHKTTLADMKLIAKAFADSKLSSTIKTGKKKDKDEKAYMTLIRGDGEKSGICTVAVGDKGETRLIVLATGGSSAESSLTDAESLLSYCLDNYRTYTAMKAGEKAGKVKVKGGQKSYAKVAAKEDLKVTLPSEGADSLVETETVLDEELKAPVEKGTVAGKVRAIEAGVVTAEVDLVVTGDIGTGGPWTKVGISDYMLIGIGAALVLLLILVIVIKVKKSRKKKKIAEMRAKKRQEEAMRIALERAEKKRRDWPY